MSVLLPPDATGLARIRFHTVCCIAASLCGRGQSPLRRVGEGATLRPAFASQSSFGISGNPSVSHAAVTAALPSAHARARRGVNEESLEPVWRYQRRKNRLSARAPNSEQWKAGEISKVAWTVAWLAGVVRLVLSVCVPLLQPVWRKCSTSAVSRWPLALC